MKSFSQKLVEAADRRVRRGRKRPRKREFLFVLALMVGAYWAGFTLLISLYDENASSETDDTVSRDALSPSRSEETMVSKQASDQPAQTPPAPPPDVPADTPPAEITPAPQAPAPPASAPPASAEATPAPPVAPSAPAPPEELRVVDVVKDRVRVRKQPIDGEILGMVSSGRKITLVAQEGDWCRIKTRRNEGWMICDALGL